MPYLVKVVEGLAEFLDLLLRNTHGIAGQDLVLDGVDVVLGGSPKLLVLNAETLPSTNKNYQ